MEAKQKKSKVNVVLLIICIVIAVAAIVTVGIVLHWFDFLKGPSKAKLTMEDYSVITVSKDYVTVTDDEVTTQIESYLTDSAQTTTETTGTVADGDTLNISYTGANMLNGEEVDSNENVAVEIGSGTFIPGFEEGLIGQPIGSTVNLPITFPDDYVEESMRGLPVLFTVTINSRYNTVVPELTEEWIDNFSQQYFGKSCTSQEEFRVLVKEDLEKILLYRAMLEDLQGKCKVESYDADLEKMLMDYSKDELSFYSFSQGSTPDDYAKASGYEDADDFAKAEAHYYLDVSMLLGKLCDDLGIEVTQ